MAGEETIAEICAEMRKFGERAAVVDHEKISPESVLVFADRIEAAWKHEIDRQSLRTIHAIEMAEREAVQDIATLRKALKEVVGALCHLCLCGADCAINPDHFCAEVKHAKAALDETKGY